MKIGVGGKIADAVCILVVLAIVYGVYGGVLPLVLGTNHVEWASCLVTRAATVVTTEDNGRIFGHERLIEAKCNVSYFIDIGMSRRENLRERFNWMANEYPGLTVGDVISCKAQRWENYDLPFQLWGAGSFGNATIDPNTCRPPGRLVK